MVKEPKYFNSWKGKILKALIIDDVSSWKELQKLTGLKETELNTAISELLTLEVIYKYNKEYYIKDPILIQEYTEFYKHQETPQTTSKPYYKKIVRDESHAKLVEYVLRKPLIGENAQNETEYRTNYFKTGRYIDVIKWIPQRGTNMIGIFEVKSKIDDIGNTIRQVKDYCHQISHPMDPKFGQLPNKQLTSYLVVEGTSHNFGIFHEFRQTFKSSGLDYLMFVDLERNEDMIITAKRFQFSHIDKLSKWIRK